MAKSKRRRSSAASARTKHGTVESGSSKPGRSCRKVVATQKAIDRQWLALPRQAKSFILGTSDGTFSLWKLVEFWSDPQNVEFTRGSIVVDLCCSAWHLALVYLWKGMHKEASALASNGFFLHQCCNSPIEEIKEVLCGSVQLTEDLLAQKLPCLILGYDSMQSPTMMENYIQSHLPKEYTRMKTSFANLADSSSMLGYINQISDDWNGTSSKRSYRPPTPINDDTHIKIILADEDNRGEKHSFDVDASTTLKTLFNDYADKRGISLRSLRFSHAGETLFLSSAGRKTPGELGLKDQDVIKVHRTGQESSSDDSSSRIHLSASSSLPQNTRANKRSNKKTEAKTMKQQQLYEPTNTLCAYKVQHSKQLTKIHDEAREQFKEIRKQLNNLVIERNQPKHRRPRTPKHGSPLSSMIENNPFKEGVGGKTGKSHFVIQVGEVQNLYKTSRHSMMHTSSPAPLPTLDLHGCTREEALVKLDERLRVWFDDAMEGSYPFVKTALIVCGCGSQVLSETVQSWIKSNEQVSNAPKFRSPGRRGCVPRLKQSADTN